MVRIYENHWKNSEFPVIDVVQSVSDHNTGK